MLMCIDLTEFLKESKDVFAWSYIDMPSLDPKIVVHRLSIKVGAKLVKQKLHWMRSKVILKIKNEVTEQYNVGFLKVINYPQ